MPSLGLAEAEDTLSRSTLQACKAVQRDMGSDWAQAGAAGVVEPCIHLWPAKGGERWGGLGIGKLSSIRPTTSRTVRFVMVYEKMRITKL